MQAKTTTGSVTILVDNLVSGKCESLGEHGFSAYLETAEGSFLFDTGMGKAVLHNAMVNKKDLTAINKIVLSHSHGDHTGGMPAVLQAVRKKPIDVYAHPDIFLHRYRREDGKETYGGIPFTKGHLERMGSRFQFNQGYIEIENGIYLTGEVPRETDFEGGDMGGRFAVRNGDIVPDIIPDDQSLIIHTEKGLLILLGCAHAGIVNILRYVGRQTGNEDIYAIIGGTHIGFSGEFQLSESIKALKKYRIQHLIPSHCTGMDSIVRLKQEFQSAFRFSHVGFSLPF